MQSDRELTSKTILGAACVAAMMLAGCSDSSTQLSFPAMPAELKDCKVFRLNNTAGERITVVRCPNSTTSTTYRQGKTEATSVVVEGASLAQAAQEGK